MSIWQWTSLINGFNEAHTPDDGSLDDEEADELFEFAQG